MEDWKSPSMAKENIAAATLKASRVCVLDRSSWDVVSISAAVKWLASRGACSSRELVAMFGVRSSRG